MAPTGAETAKADVPALDLGLLRETVAALREATDLVVPLSTGGAVTDPEADRLQVLEAAPDAAEVRGLLGVRAA